MKALLRWLGVAAIAAGMFGHSAFAQFSGGGGGGGGGGGSVTWPSATDLVVSLGPNNNPTGLAPVNGEFAVGAGTNWLARALTAADINGLSPSFTNLTVTGTCTGCGGGGSLPSLTNGQILGNATGSTATAQATGLVAGSGITLTATGGMITIGASGSGGVSGPGVSVNNDLACWNGTSGNALLDCGVGVASLVPTSRTVSTTGILTGGGNLASNLNIGATVPTATLLGGASNGFTTVTIPTASLLGGTGSAFVGIGVGGCLSISGGTLVDSCTGTVTSVGLSLPTAVFSISGSPVTGSGNLTGSFVNQSANSFFAGPSSGSAAAPGFRAIAGVDLPATGVTPGSYTTMNATVGSDGRITSASNGSASSPVGFTGTTAGTANAQTIAAPSPSGYTLTDQNVIHFKVGVGLANTAVSPTLNVNSTGAEPMDVQSGGALASLPIGYLQAGLQYSTTYQAGCTCYVVTTTPSSGITQATTSTSGTGASPTAAQFAFGQSINLNAASLTSTIPVSTTLSPGGGVVINAINAGTLTATSPDTITTAAGTTGAGGSITLAAGTVTFVTTDGAGHLYAAGNTGGGSSNSAPIRVVSTGATVNVLSTDGTVVIKATAALAVDYTCVANQVFTIKDGLGNDGTDALTLTPSAGTIDGASTFVMSSSHSGVPPYEGRKVQCDSSGNGWIIP